jgi:hypothetical protein
MWHCLENSDGFYSVDNSRNAVETSVVYYPVAHSRHLGEYIRELKNGISIPRRVHTNQSVTGNQRATVILK